MILDHPIMAVVRVILTILSAIGGVGMLFNISRHFFSNTLRCSQTFVIMKDSERIERVRNRRQKIMSDTESEYNDTDEYETDDEVHLKKRIINEAPPPYSS